VTEAVRHFDGIPVKYLGDGALSFFSGATMTERACRAAMRVRDLVEGVDVVLHRGEIYLGTIGHPDHATLDILGAAVNTAFIVLPHVHQRCPGRIAATGPVAADLPDAIEARKVTALEIDGESAAIELFDLLSRG
jgi:class 3 adenylate cyclase